jgi:hypothetical protein
MKNNSNYGSGMPFEAFMRRALKTYDRSISKGTCSSIYETLVRIEDGTSLIKISYEKQLKKVKSSLTKGINAFLKRKLHSGETMRLEKLQENLASAKFIIELDLIIDEALNITMPYKEWDKH